MTEMLKNSLIVNERFFTLYDRMISDDELPEVLREAAEVVCQALNAERTTMYLVNRETQELESAATIGNVTRSIRIPISRASLAGYCALTGRSFVVEDAYGDLSGIDPQIRFDKTWDEHNSFRTRDVMCAPALFKGELIGVAQVMNSKGAPFQESDLLPLQSVSRLVGYTLYHARMLHDISTLKRLDQEKAEFMKIMVHELKSPVSASKMMIDVLEMDRSGDPDILAITSKIGSRMSQLLDLIKDILELSRVKSGSPLGDVSVLDVANETINVCNLYRDQAENKKLIMNVELPEQPVPVRFDSKGLNLIISNLVSNAVKYTQEGSVTVTLQRSDPWALFTVADTGMGIPEDEIPKLFREFYRASNAKKNRILGTGVGLSSVKQIVERFGGELELQSRENEGSVFTVRLPLHTEQPSS